MSRIAEIRQNVLKKNDLLAGELRAQFEAAGVTVINLVSGPGSGKTALLEATLRLMQALSYRVAALVGDLATDRDAQRLSRSGARVMQITTGTVCHLDADMVRTALTGWRLEELDFLFIENVGNLVCPASYDVGETTRAVLLSVTEGEDKPLKYPTLFNSADVAIITKIDLVDAVGFDRDEAYRNIHEVSPGLPIVDTSTRAGNIDRWIDYLTGVRTLEREERAAAAGR